MWRHRSSLEPPSLLRSPFYGSYTARWLRSGVKRGLRAELTGGLGDLVWQSVEASWGACSGFPGFGAWWQTSHLPATWMCPEWGNITTPIVGPFMAMGWAGACWLRADNQAAKSTVEHMRQVSCERDLQLLGPINDAMAL